MNAVIAWLEGKKTTIGLLLLAVYEIGSNSGWWSYDQNFVIALAALTGASFATKINRMTP